MVAVKTVGLLALLQIAAVAAKRVCGTCNANDDRLLQLLSAEPEAVSFCGEFLGVAPSTVEFTVTPTIVVSSTVTTTDTTITTELFSSTTTVDAPVPSITRIEILKRDVPYPEWLPETYRTGRVSYGCKCLRRSMSTPVVTSTKTAEVVTATEASTTTDTVTDTYQSTVIVAETAEAVTTTGVSTTTDTMTSTSQSSVTETAEPVPSVVTKRAMIQVFRKSTDAAVGWMYMSNGPAITSDPTLAGVVRFDVLEGVKTASQLRLTPEGYSPAALGFNVPASQSLGAYYGGMIADIPTPPGSLPVTSSATKYATDIWAINTVTKEIGYQWIESDGTAPSSIYLYRVGGRLYPVGNVAVFNSATGGASSAKYDVSFKYVEI